MTKSIEMLKRAKRTGEANEMLKRVQHDKKYRDADPSEANWRSKRDAEINSA